MHLANLRQNYHHPRVLIFIIMLLGGEVSLCHFVPSIIGTWDQTTTLGHNYHNTTNYHHHPQRHHHCNHHTQIHHCLAGLKETKKRVYLGQLAEMWVGGVGWSQTFINHYSYGTFFCRKFSANSCLNSQISDSNIQIFTLQGKLRSRSP